MTAVIGNYSKQQQIDKQDMSTWDNTELIKFIAWNFAKNDPDTVEQFQAMRDLERSVENDRLMEKQMKEMEWMKRQMELDRNAITSNPYSIQTDGTSGFWSSFKQAFKQ